MRVQLAWLLKRLRPTRRMHFAPAVHTRARTHARTQRIDRFWGVGEVSDFATARCLSHRLKFINGQLYPLSSGLLLPLMRS